MIYQWGANNGSPTDNVKLLKQPLHLSDSSDYVLQQITGSGWMDNILAVRNQQVVVDGGYLTNVIQIAPAAAATSVFLNGVEHFSGSQGLVLIGGVPPGSYELKSYSPVLGRWFYTTAEVGRYGAYALSFL